MIMADKIIGLRKKSGWSQEELAEKLNVSRQSVSKWEGAQSTPDLNKVVSMAKLFGVSTDYLLKDDMEEAELVPAEDYPDYDGEIPTRYVSMEEANAFLEINESCANQIAVGVLLCILSVVPVILLGVAGETHILPFSEDVGGLIGAILMLIIIASAVFLFVKNGMLLNKSGICRKVPFGNGLWRRWPGKGKESRIREQAYAYDYRWSDTLCAVGNSSYHGSAC